MKSIKALKYIKSSRRGFTLVEVLVAIAIVAVIGTAAVASMGQVITNSGKNNNEMIALSNLKSAAFWLSQDTRQAYFIAIDSNTNCPAITYYDFNGNSHQILYTHTGQTLGRSVDSGPVQNVAENITSIQSSLNGNIFVISLTSTVGSGSQQSSVTRSYQVTLRNR